MIKIIFSIFTLLPLNAFELFHSPRVTWVHVSCRLAESSRAEPSRMGNNNDDTRTHPAVGI